MYFCSMHTAKCLSQPHGSSMSCAMLLLTSHFTDKETEAEGVPPLCSSHSLSLLCRVCPIPDLSVSQEAELLRRLFRPCLSLSRAWQGVWWRMGTHWVLSACLPCAALEDGSEASGPRAWEFGFYTDGT